MDAVTAPVAWKEDPARVQSFYDRQRIHLGRLRPTAAHHALARLQAHHATRIVTQNTDDLHERAGSREVIHLHGELLRLRSLLNPGWTEPIGYEAQDPARRGAEGERLRPDIVWSGEPVRHLAEARAVIATARELWLIGTAVPIYPAADLWRLAPPSCIVRVVDAVPPEDPPVGWHIHTGVVDDIVPYLVDQAIATAGIHP